jgi:adenosylhomocysteinase
LPKILDEEVARLHLAHVNAELETLTIQQSGYINVDIAGPYKTSTYRY